jgi:hypothetical protein
VFLKPNRDVEISQLKEKIRRASVVTPELMSDVIDKVCLRLHALPYETNRLPSLLAAGAWIEAALVLIDLEVPQWTLRRLGHDGGYWYCSLSKRLRVPDWLDDSVDAFHEVLPLAIISAFLEVHQARFVASDVSPHTVPECRAQFREAINIFNCDNFA